MFFLKFGVEIVIKTGVDQGNKVALFSNSILGFSESKCQYVVQVCCKIFLINLFVPFGLRCNPSPFKSDL